MKTLILILVAVFLSIPEVNAQNTITVTGTITDDESKVPLEGTAVQVKGQTTGAVTDKNGNFSLPVPLENGKAVLHITYIGYSAQDVEVTATSNTISIALKVNAIMGNMTVVSASRYSEKILESPVTIEKMDMSAIKETPAINYYDGIGNLKGVDMVTTGMLFKTMNTRGFNTTLNFRFIQLVDGMDNQSPVTNYAPGNLIGIPDVDVESVELIPGSSSALYGPNAFNGIVNITSKDPFKYQGLSVTMKSGVNHLNDNQKDVSPLNELQLRYAKAINKKFAFKLVGNFFKGEDWVADDSTDVDLLSPLSKLGASNPARDAVNIYGDEIVSSLPLGPGGTSVRVSRTGYHEKDLIDNHLESLKTFAGLSYKINPTLFLTYDFGFATGTSPMQGNTKVSVKDFKRFTHKVELKGNKLMIRAYRSSSESGDSYDCRFLSFNMNRAWKTDKQWFTEYSKAYAGAIPTVTKGNHDAARAYADNGRLLPGDERFNTVKDSVSGLSNLGGFGSRYGDESFFYHGETQYHFDEVIKAIDLVAGANYRFYNMESHGTIFADSAGPIQFYETGGFVQGNKKLFNDLLRITGSVRYDKMKNFDGEFTPRIGVMMGLNKSHYFRTSYQTGFDFPTAINQYVDYNLGFVHLVGGLPEISNQYSVYGKSFTKQSVSDFGVAVGTYVASHPGDSLAAGVAVNKYKELLKESTYGYLKPEHVKTVEAGYRGLFFDKRLFVDLSGWYSEYVDFITTYVVIKPLTGGPENADSILTAAANISKGKYAAYQLYGNISKPIINDGVSLGIGISLPKNFQVTANTTFSECHQPDLTGESPPPFSTPRWKTNVGVSNKKLYKELGFAMNWKWTESYEWLSTVHGRIPTANQIDLQMNYHLSKVATTIRLGSTNMLNYYHTEFYAGPSVGGVYYVSLLYDGIFKYKN